ncbi:MAG: HEAT repeat domain-containing protein [Planctomycetes bacterium]|nr:HEAT repeat domain-containing protein [Planctomycetota bacterium]
MTQRIVPLLILAGLCCLSLPAQTPEQLLEEVRQRMSRMAAKQSAPQITELEALVGELQTLHGAPADVREKACGWMFSLLKKGGMHDRRIRMRLLVLRMLAVLAEDPAWADRLIELSLRGGTGSLSGVHFWVERALGTLRGAGHVDRLIAHVRGKDVRARRLALGALARLEDEGLRPRLQPLIPELAEIADGDDTEARIRSLDVLGTLDPLAVLPTLLAAGKDADPLIRLAAVRALAKKASLPGVVAYLSRLLTDDVALVREEAVMALSRAPDRSAVPLLVRRLEKEPLRIRIALNATLRGLTGFDHGHESGPWTSWLKSVQAAGKLEEVRPKLDAYSKPKPKPAEYFDIPVLSDRMLFVLDVSGSMDYSVGASSKAPTRMAHARRELIRVLQALDERSRFNIIFFDQKIRVWTSGLAPATARNKQLAIQSVQTLVPRGGTDSYGALELAFRGFRGIDTVYFLSDGVPSAGKSISQEKILQRVWEWNRLRGIRIHTIALQVGEQLNPFRRKRENKDEAARFMRILAEETGGTFTDLR